MLRRMNYTFGTTIDGTIDEVVDRVTERLSGEGFGILTTIDVAATIENKLGIIRSPYVILGACNPQLAHEALEIEPDLGALLPCNVYVRQDDDGIFVGFADPEAMFSIVDNPGVASIATEVRTRLQRVNDAL